MEATSTRVALVSPGWPPSRVPNGIVTYTAEMRAAFGLLGVEAYVLALWPEGDPGPGVVSAVRSGAIARVRRSLRWRLMHQPADVVPEDVVARARELRKGPGLSLLEMEESHGWVGKVARAGVVPVVARLHGPHFINGPVLGLPQDDAFRDRVERERAGILAATAVTSPSQDVLDRTRAFYEITLEDAAVIPHPMAPAPPEDVWSPEASDTDTILCVGRFDRLKGGDVIVDALADLPGVKLLFAGPDLGFNDDAGRTWSLEEYLARLAPDVRKRVTWLGPQPHDALRRLRRQAALVVVPSRAETLGNTALEGMAQGTPLVVARAGALPEVIRHEHDGLLFASEDPSDLARQAARLLNDRALAIHLGAQARRGLIERYAPRAIAERTLRFYRLLV